MVVSLENTAMGARASVVSLENKPRLIRVAVMSAGFWTIVTTARREKIVISVRRAASQTKIKQAARPALRGGWLTTLIPEQSARSVRWDKNHCRTGTAVKRAEQGITAMGANAFDAALASNQIPRPIAGAIFAQRESLLQTDTVAVAPASARLRTKFRLRAYLARLANSQMQIALVVTSAEIKVATLTATQLHLRITTYVRHALPAHSQMKTVHDASGAPT